MGKLFQPGQSGNPKGMKKGTRSVNTEINKTLRNKLIRPIKGGEKNFVELYVETLFEEALDPKSLGFRMIGDYLLKNRDASALDAMLDKRMARDVDFLTYRIIKDATDIQQRILISNNPKKYNMAGRRSGKTHLDIKNNAKTLVRPGGRALYIGLTMSTAIQQVYDGVMKELERIGVEVTAHNRTEGTITIKGEGLFQVKGNSTTDEREKLRGEKWDLITIGEVQSQKALAYLINDICEPMLLDRKGQLVLSGTGPRVRGTYWEVLWTDGGQALKNNWNLTQNPHIPDAETVLARIREEKGLKETDPLYQREYLGQIAYDDDALVFRLSDANRYSEHHFAEWLARQTVTDIAFVGGMDFGFSDADAFVIMCFARGSREVWLVDCYKMRRESTRDFSIACHERINRMRLKYAQYMHNEFMIYADSGGGGAKIIKDLQDEYGLPAIAAYKKGKEMAVEILRDDIRGGVFKTPGNTDFDDECLKTVYKRDDADNLTHELDDDTYHGDAIPAVLYACRAIWLQQGREKR